jgi:hypothetical protein
VFLATNLETQWLMFLSNLRESVIDKERVTEVLTIDTKIEVQKT